MATVTHSVRVNQFCSQRIAVYALQLRGKGRAKQRAAVPPTIASRFRHLQHNLSRIPAQTSHSLYVSCARTSEACTELKNTNSLFQRVEALRAPLSPCTRLEGCKKKLDPPFFPNLLKNLLCTGAFCILPICQKYGVDVRGPNPPSRLLGAQ